jgi:energy-converting hydrogenase Eha subunit A
MTPVVQLYWTRCILGIVAGVLSAIVALYIGDVTDLTTLVNGITIALIVYLASYYPLRAVYRTKIEKQSKILSTGIFMYFFTWLPFFALFFTIIKMF